MADIYNPLQSLSLIYKYISWIWIKYNLAFVTTLSHSKASKVKDQDDYVTAL